MELAPGDCLINYTDALIESCDADGRMLGEDGLLRIVNLAHGSYFLLGGYVALSVIKATGFWALSIPLAAVAGTLPDAGVAPTLVM